MCVYTGVYTKYLLKHLTADRDIELVLRDVTNDVATETGEKQVPWKNCSLRKPLSLGAAIKA